MHTVIRYNPNNKLQRLEEHGTVYDNKKKKNKKREKLCLSLTLSLALFHRFVLPARTAVRPRCTQGVPKMIPKGDIVVLR